MVVNICECKEAKVQCFGAGERVISWVGYWDR